ALGSDQEDRSEIDRFRAGSRVERRIHDERAWLPDRRRLPGRAAARLGEFRFELVDGFEIAEIRSELRFSARNVCWTLSLLCPNGMRCAEHKSEQDGAGLGHLPSPRQVRT